MQYSRSQKIEFSPTIHLSFEHFQTVDLSFNLSLAPFKFQGSFDPTFADNGLFKNWNIEILSDGKIITKHPIGIGYGNSCVLERYSENGTFETILNTFLPNVPTARQISLTCEDTAIQPDNRIVVLGKNNPVNYSGNMGLMRLLSAPAQLKNGK